MAAVRFPPLQGRDVHVWPVSIDLSAEVADRLRPLLSSDEVQRASEFDFDHLQRSYIVTRGTLRILLAEYLLVRADAIEFVYGDKGKPALCNGSRLEFSVAHSGDLSLFAFTRECQIGIDVEQVKPLPNKEQIANVFFSPEERSDLLAIPDEDRERAFYHCWTRKEAYIKALGEGLSEPLDAFRVTVKPGEQVRLIHVAENSGAAEEWTLHNLETTQDYAAAVAYRDRERNVEIFPFTQPSELLNFSNISVSKLF